MAVMSTGVRHGEGSSWILGVDASEFERHIFRLVLLEFGPGKHEIYIAIEADDDQFWPTWRGP